MILTFIITAMALGFLGSFHCVGMCGPIALSIPVQHLHGFQKFIGIIIYNGGRIMVYAVAGSLFGVIGLSFQFMGWQKWLSVILGVVLLLLFVFAISKKRFSQNRFLKSFNDKIVQWLYPLLQSRKQRNLLLIGMLNGLLPCGLVYMALAGAIATSNIIYSAIFMAAFGAGTLPAMILASYAGQLITLNMRNKIKKVLPYMLAIMGLLLILRGFNMHLPLFDHMGHHGNAVLCK